MSRHIQITFDAHDPIALSCFWRDALGYVHPAPPGVELPEGADPLAARTEIMDMVLAAARVGFIYDQLQNEKRETGKPVPLQISLCFKHEPGNRSPAGLEHRPDYSAASATGSTETKTLLLARVRNDTLPSTSAKMV